MVIISRGPKSSRRRFTGKYPLTRELTSKTTSMTSPGRPRLFELTHACSVQPHRSGAKHRKLTPVRIALIQEAACNAMKSVRPTIEWEAHTLASGACETSQNILRGGDPCLPRKRKNFGEIMATRVVRHEVWSPGP